MIEISGLEKTWEGDDTPVLRDINLIINDGEFYAIVGRSGAGKSTLLRCINGLTDYQAGSLKVDGQEVKNLNEKQLRDLRRNIGMIFQHFSLLERATVFQNVALPMKCWGFKKEEIEKKVTELLELVGLDTRAHARPRNLSGGQKQRVAIARALTMNPKFLLSDESTSALDPKTTGSILDLLMEINEKNGDHRCFCDAPDGGCASSLRASLRSGAWGSCLRGHGREHFYRKARCTYQAFR